MKATSFILLGMLVPVGLAFGHGAGSETLPPVEMDGRMITMQVSSEQNPDGGISIEAAMVDNSTQRGIGGARYMMELSYGGETVLLDNVESNDGRIQLEVVSEDTPRIEVRLKSQGGFFGILTRDYIEIAGAGLAGGGLYSLDITVLEADGYLPPQPPVFNSAISVPARYNHTIHDRHWGDHNLTLITYYDRITDISYQESDRIILFSMPFQWDPDVILQIETVHMEIAVPESLGDLLVSRFAARINGHDIPPEAITVDDYFADSRIIHIVLLQTDLTDIYGMVGDADTMDFALRPWPGAPYSSVTANGQYRLLASPEPPGLPVGGHATVSFNVTNVFLRNQAVEVPYAVSVIHNGSAIHRQEGVSSATEATKISFVVPEHASGIGRVSFHSIDGNDLSTASIPVMFGRGSVIPDWVRVTAGWWADGQIDDGAFAGAMGYLISQGAIDVRPVQNDSGKGMDDWVRVTAGWWARGMISDAEFLAALEYMAGAGIIRVHPGG